MSFNMSAKDLWTPAEAEYTGKQTAIILVYTVKSNYQILHMQPAINYF